MQIMPPNGEFNSSEHRELKTEKYETELKFQLTNPDVMMDLVDKCKPLQIHQLYLSSPDEPYSLRLRHTVNPQGESVYEACLKSRGLDTEDGIKRLESNITISETAFREYELLNPPQLFKERYEPLPGVVVDVIDGIELPLVEIEDISLNQDVFEFYNDFKDVLKNVTSTSAGDNEALAYSISETKLENDHQIDSELIFQEIVARQKYQPKDKPSIYTIYGRSGSGKTTTANELGNRLKESFPNLNIEIMSTDDYHRGRMRLEEMLGGVCKNWDADYVYDTKSMAFDIWELLRGKEIEKRKFDFRSQEVIVDGKIKPADIILIEGIVAQSQDLDTIRSAHFDISTPLATCIGRDMERIRQDSRGNGGIGDQLDRLKYIIETAEPTYKLQDRKIRNQFSASTRPY